MAAAVFGALTKTLGPLILKEIGLIMGVNDEMRKLASTLTTIQAVLEDAEDKQFKSGPIQDWLHKLNDLAYEIDDVVDECATEVSKSEHDNNGLLNRISLEKILNQREIGQRVKEVTDKLDAVAAERAKFHLNTHDLSKPVERQTMIDAERETSSVLNEPDVYGRDDEKNTIVDILVNDVRDSQELSVLPILGIGGLGKTTLAQLVYNDDRVKHHFDPKLWVCVSDNFDIKTLIKAMIESATEERSDCDTMNALQLKLRKLLKEKRYLLILDDVWNDNQLKWKQLKDILSCGSGGASIVVTTRLEKVARMMGTLPKHQLSGLSEEHGWLLFRQYAFGQETDEHPNLEAIGKQIVKKCGGVPLAAKALGSLLLFKREEKDWVDVRDGEIWNFSEDEDLIMPVLRLSYKHLPIRLRSCFTYCAVYPKDYEIKKEELIYCWMAHGYISSRGRKDVEDVGNEVWNELVLRSLFQDVRRNYYRQTICKMHDLVHDLAQSIMENNVPREEGASSYQSELNQNKIRQVNIREQYVAFPRSLQKEVTISYTLQNYNRLRMLDASGTDMKDLPSEIGKLIHLRYLNLSRSQSLRTLPDTICNLWNLKILNLSNCYYLVSLPRNMTQLKNLRHLLLVSCYQLSEMPSFTSLQTPSLFIVGRERGNKFDELQNLHLGPKLEIRHLDRVKNHLDVKKANIGEMSNVRDLLLEWEGFNAAKEQQEMDEKVLEALEPHSNLETLEICGYRGRYLPAWKKMENITKIDIEGCANCLWVTPLGYLPRLKVLQLIDLNALKYVMENKKAVQVGDHHEVKKEALFPSLKHLKLESVPNLKGLLKEENVGEVIFPELQNLDIPHDCTLLNLPALLALKELAVFNCSILTLNSINKCANLTFLFVGFDKRTKTTCNTKVTLENLSKLERLKIGDAKEHSPQIGGLQGLKSLKKLEIVNCKTLTCLPDGWWQDLTALETLDIDDDDELTSLSEWLGNLTSLRCLYIGNCPRLTSLPPSIKRMTNLKTLSIGAQRIGEVNGELKRRCEKGKGEDWHLISHIPNVTIDEF